MIGKELLKKYVNTAIITDDIINEVLHRKYAILRVTKNSDNERGIDKTEMSFQKKKQNKKQNIVQKLRNK